jgi:hypothetical protein
MKIDKPILTQVKMRLRSLRLKIFYFILKTFEKHTGKTVTIQVRPLFAKDITRAADPLVKEPLCAIVLQGGIMKQHDFTLETVLTYKELYPSLTIIVSTWESEDPKYLDRIRNAGADVVLNLKPTYAGKWNINMQIISAKSGIARAKELGIPYVIKSRTDQRIYTRNIIETLCNLISYFPPAKQSGLKKRIVVCHDAYKYCNGYLPDMFMFGDTDDLLEYWSPSLLEKEMHFSGEFFSELYLSYSFFRRKGWRIPDSMQLMWNIYRDSIIVIDWDDLDLLWLKYDYIWAHRYTYKERYQQLTAAHKFIDFQFSEWFNIYSNKENKIVSPAFEAKFAQYLEAVNFPDYERNYKN